MKTRRAFHACERKSTGRAGRHRRGSGPFQVATHGFILTNISRFNDGTSGTTGLILLLMHLGLEFGISLWIKKPD